LTYGAPAQSWNYGDKIIGNIGAGGFEFAYISTLLPSPKLFGEVFRKINIYSSPFRINIGSNGFDGCIEIDSLCINTTFLSKSIPSSLNLL